MPGAILDSASMTLRAAREISGGEAVAIGQGLPALIPGLLPPGSAAWFLAESGAVGYYPGEGHTAVDAEGAAASVLPGGAVVGAGDVAAMLAEATSAWQLWKRLRSPPTATSSTGPRQRPRACTPLASPWTWHQEHEDS